MIRINHSNYFSEPENSVHNEKLRFSSRQFTTMKERLYQKIQ